MEHLDLRPMEATPEIHKNENSRNGFWQGMLLTAIFFTSIGLIACGSDSGGGGTGDTTTQDIQLSVNGTVYNHNDSVILGTIDGTTVTSSTTTVTISNTGTSALTLTGSPVVEITGTNAGDFTADTTVTTSTVAPGESTTADIVFTRATKGLSTAQLTLLSDDSDEGTYTLNLRAQYGNPNIEVWNATFNVQELNNTAGYSFNSFCTSGTDPCTSWYTALRTYTIKNTGVDPLNIKLPMDAITGTDAADFTLDTATAPTTTPVPAGGTTDFNISFLPTVGQTTRSAQLVIVSDDLDEGNFTLLLSGMAQ